MAAAAMISNSLILTRNPQGVQFSQGLSSSSSIKPLDKRVFGVGLGKLRVTSSRTSGRSLTVQAAAYSDDGRPSNASIFVGGFVLGGLIVGALGCVYAPQISKALAGTDRKDLMRKLPKFIYDEEKALEKTRKILAAKIEQLNSAIDDVSAQLRPEDAPNGASVHSEAAK
ncbi:unnamed protein product [Dovyalis caffra]|uniref:Uncharacterized protein n=1 Tax=Dovyalis caffra TaxID=77055 RepID=A0AAV1S6Z2_9ROSI|nr:unnamed protein product [Dovyalis caffra]